MKDFPVLLTASVMIYVEGNPNTLDRAMTAVDASTERLRRAVAEAFADVPDSTAIGTVAFNYPTEEAENISRCSQCQVWVTDPRRECPRDGLPYGYDFEGRMLCCQCWEIANKIWESV